MQSLTKFASIHVENFMYPNQDEIDRIIEIALIEDIGMGDITSTVTIPEDKTASFAICTRQDLLVCGAEIAAQVFSYIEGYADVEVAVKIKDGDVAKKGDAIITGKGNARVIMAGERVALNLLRQMCGVASLTRRFANEIKGTNAKLLDTRKTIPGLRSLQKYAVKIGGGVNHRIGLYDGILIKDNHIAICGGVREAVLSAKKLAPSGYKIEVECDTLEQVKVALECKADVIMLDNMTLEELREAVKLSAGEVPLEASGGVRLNTIRPIAETGVDFISVGCITNTPDDVDIGLDMA